ncbi:MAG TPA: M20/M25/M40 family metallo-hydrolase [Blastocatellia bacterium]|nr:M20/M25/M40 family metallo-hydrolase [Blastocatellia bacterium]
MKKHLAYITFVWFSATFLFASAQAQKLSAEEQKLVNFVDAHTTEAIALLEKAVNIESPTQNLDGVKKVGLVFKSELDAIGFKTKWIEMPAEMKRAGHLLAELDGTKGKRVLLLGHVDTVLSGEKFRREGDKAYGTGSSDMKAGDVVLLYALKALHDAGLLKDTRIIVLLTGDEEASGHPTEISRGDMIAAAERSDLALSFEGNVRNTATVGRRGSSSWTLEVTGETGHSSGVFGQRMGAGAIFEASRILNQFYEQLHAEKYLTFNPSIILGGSSEVNINSASGTAAGKTNVVPNKVIVKGDLRFISEQQKEVTRAKMREIVAKNLPRTSAKITFEDGIPAMTPVEANYVLLKQYDQVSQDLGFGKIEALDPGERGAGDIAFISHLIPGLDGLGAKGGNSHAPGEWADTASMPTLIKRTAVMLYRLTR